MRAFVKLMTSFPRYYWLLLILAPQPGYADPNGVGEKDGGHLTIISKNVKETNNSVKENNEMSIVMNSTAFLNVLGDHIKQIMNNHTVPLRSGGANSSDCDRKCDCSSPTSEKTKGFKLIYSTPLPWYGALAYCKERNMDLASIHNQEDHNKLIEEVRKSGYGSHSFWVGGTILSPSHGWFWIVDGKETSLNNWLYGKPDNLGDGQKCMTYLNGWKSDRRWGWDDDVCTVAFFFACEYYY